MKKILPKILLAFVFVLTLFLGFRFANIGIDAVIQFDPGIPASRLEADIRKEQKIPDTWTVEGNVSDTMAAFISYPKDKATHVFSVYVNRPGLSAGYFFRGGGTTSTIGRDIAQFTVQGYNEAVFISMNTKQVFQVEIGDGNHIRVLDIDPNKPFALLLPLDEGNICFYNLDGERVEYYKQAV
jgi:hypothetical protein